MTSSGLGFAAPAGGGDDSQPVLPHSLEMGFLETQEEIDAFLAKSMAQLSTEEREMALEELHGIQKPNSSTQEDDTSVALWLQKLDERMKIMKRGTLYEIAEAMDKSYLTNRDFCMMFLRANRYDSEEAATNMLQFLETKQQLFGQDKLVKAITLADFTEEERKYIESGSMQYSPFTDMAGRKLLIVLPNLRKVTNIQSELRARFYVLMSSIQDSSGMVGVYYASGENEQQVNESSSFTGILWSLPIYWAGFHMCVSHPKMYCLEKEAIFRIPPKMGPKFRVHCGSDAECMSILSTFGIPHKALPFSAGSSSLDTKRHMDWYRDHQQQQLELTEKKKKQQQEKELESEQRSTTTTATTATTATADVAACAPNSHIVYAIPIAEPGPKDVLFGRVRSNLGNQSLRRLVSGLLEDYDKSNRCDKTKIAGNVVDEIQKRGGRFLKQTDDSSYLWECVSRTEAVRKVAHTFRNCRRSGIKPYANS